LGLISFSEEARDDVRPASAGDGGVGKAMTAVVKALPRGKTDGLKTLGACAKALESLAAWKVGLTAAKVAVGNGRDDARGAAARLKAPGTRR
jgi:hypothetical protein